MLFEITLPNNWLHNLDNNVYSFYPENEFEGILQISNYYNQGDVEFDPSSVLLKELGSHPTAHIVDMGNYKAIHYGKTSDEQILQYCWIAGFKKVILFCTLTLPLNYSETELDQIYGRVTKILDTVLIRSPKLD